jgi:hypothetical protein
MKDGTFIYGDELGARRAATTAAPSTSSCPTFPVPGRGPIAIASASPLDSRQVYGLRVAASKSSNWGQGAETGTGAWVEINLGERRASSMPTATSCENRAARAEVHGYYRPEDMDVDPIARAKGVFRACWANTGRLSHAGGSVAENTPCAAR